ncbi:MAG: hypothetical protein QM589_10450 [Thermomicrobiales bacterium]
MDALSWDSLTTRPSNGELIDGLSIVSLVVFGCVFVVVSALAIWPRLWGLRRQLGRTRFGRLLSTGLWLSSLGLIFLILRFLQIDPITLARPIWLVVVMIGVAVWIGWFTVMLMFAREPAPVETAAVPVYRRPRRGGSYR